MDDVNEAKDNEDQKKKEQKKKKDQKKQEPPGSKDATTLSSLIQFLLFFVFDGRTDRRTDIFMSFYNCR